MAAGWAWGAGEGCCGVVVVCPVLKLVADSRLCDAIPKYGIILQSLSSAMLKKRSLRVLVT